MQLVGDETCPLPEDPLLAEVAEALNAAGTWAFVIDSQWRLVYMTDDIRLSNGRLRELVPVPLGVHIFSREAMDVVLAWSGRVFTLESWQASLHASAGWIVADTPEGLDAVDPRLLEGLGPVAPETPGPALTYSIPAFTSWSDPVSSIITAVRIRDSDGALAGTLVMPKPAVNMSVMGTITGAGDLGHFERMQRLVKLARRPAAILFADLEGSSALARRLSTTSYFTLGRRIVRAADRAVVDAGGMVGRHAGDGLVALFLAETFESESQAARACIDAARTLQRQVGPIAERSGLEPDAVVLRFGLHWGGTLQVGHIVTAARAEVNALGEEMNEAARIEACATGGRVLASKALIERLEESDAAALGLEPDSIAYTGLGDLPTATEKARRDAPAIAVCEL